ncbi:hypothetical protein COLO4_24956 [Corchorus olitorius]|uniref:DUF4283 domain-containing protein n=1 Tax=Corchorus olitorius TaxID=93759 RepID=A0A1R3I5N0_9ROSI|nr:hypothetical protein COLO4_24956 [Corchorus olitorius]
MEPPRGPPRVSRIRLMRECSWSNSDSSSEESGDSAQNERMNVPVSEPQMKPRRSHAFSFSAEELEERRSEGQACLVGFLLDARRFSTEFIQNYINREWEIRGTATVIGRDGNKFLIHYNREIDRRVGVHANPWAIEGAIFVQQPWNPNIPLAQTTLPRIALWLQIWDLPFEYQQPFVARRMALSAGEVLQIDWEDRMPRNIRFMRVRISADLTVPLVPGYTLERDDGSSQWIRRTESNFQEALANIHQGLQGPQPLSINPPQHMIEDNPHQREEGEDTQHAMRLAHQDPTQVDNFRIEASSNAENNLQQYEQNANLEEREPDDNQEEPAMTFENQDIERHSPPIQLQGEQNQVEAH